MPVYQVESGNLKLFYAGYSPIKRNYYARLILSRKDRETLLGRFWYWKITRLIEESNVDFAFSEISPVTFKYFRNITGFVIPVWTTTRINISRSLNEICNRNSTDFSNVLRRIRKYNLQYEILTGEGNYNYFRERFYLPYITKRHGDEAFVENLNELWSSTPKPFLLAVKENGNTVGMSLLRKEGESLQFKRLGLIDGNKEYRNHGVIGALYYFGILEGQRLGCEYFDLGGTRPFLSDGLTKYKLGLGAEFVTRLSRSKEYVWFGLNLQSSASMEFLEKNPFMYLDKDFHLIKHETPDPDICL
jgi:hypothetical protein